MTSCEQCYDRELAEEEHEMTLGKLEMDKRMEKAREIDEKLKQIRREMEEGKLPF